MARMDSLRPMLVCGAMLSCTNLSAADAPRITLTTTRFGGFQLMTIGMDGSNSQQMTSEPAGASQGAWSPDGKQIAYVAGHKREGRIKIMNADGSNAHYLLGLDQPPQRSPQWSPDGKLLALTMNSRKDLDADHVYLVNPDGTGLTDLTDEPRFSADPCWSPDGKQIAYVSLLSDGTHLFVMNADGTAKRDVTQRVHGYAVYPNWTRDGKQIAYSSPDSADHNQIHLVNPDGSGDVTLTNDSAGCSYPAWSADGQYMAYISGAGTNSGTLYVCEYATNERKQVVAKEVMEEFFLDGPPAWVPEQK